jgi:dihydrofolate synthase/folylpolyglutamate synthase
MTGLPEPVELDDLLEPFAVRGVDLGLERLRTALAAGGNPEAAFPAVQVAGTNGKGSICTVVHAILRAASLRVGTYRSPHLISWCERVRLDDRWISPGELRADLARWQEIGRRHGLTPFELLTAAAFDRFAAEAVDLAVLEVGLGGRLDATTAHPRRQVLGFGAIGMDHREHLGSTLAAIAFEKAGVMTPGGVAISGPQEPEARRVLEERAAELGCRLRWVEPLPAAAAGGPLLGLQGDLQRSNAAVAAAMAEELAAQGWPISETAIRTGLAAARWPGRLERWQWQGRELLIDGAHNPPAAAALRQEIDRLDGGGARRWLLGIQRHKDGPAVVGHLLRSGDQAAIVAIADHASWSVEELTTALPQCTGQLRAVSCVAEGLAWLEPAGLLPVVAGSLYLLGQVLPLLEPQPQLEPPQP